MNDLQKVLVVDDGDRNPIDSLSAELAELGYSSVTASFEAADQVLDVIQRPSAIFLKMPARIGSPDYQNFLALAEMLRQREGTSGVPVIMWERQAVLPSGGLSVLLDGEPAPKVLTAPEA